MGHVKKCVARIAGQQARHGDDVCRRSLRPRESGGKACGAWVCDVYAIGVDRCGLLVGGGEAIRRIQAA